MAAGDIVPVPGDSFEQTLASASPDLLREMIREFAQRMMDADVEVRCNAGYGEVTPEGTIISLPLTQEELGAWTGASHAGVAKALQTLRELGWIQTQRKRIVVRNMDALRRRSS